MSREARRLSAMYLVFAVFLFAAALEDREQPAPASGGQLQRVGVPEENRHLAEALGSTLRGLGFTLAPPPVAVMVPRGASAPALDWTFSARNDAARELALAGTELAKTAAEHGAQVLRSEWELVAGCFRLRLEFGGADGGKTLLSLRAKEAVADPARVIARRALPGFERPRSERPRPAAPGAQLGKKGPRVAIILDDVGEVAGTEEFLALPAQLTIAVMPFRRYSQAYAGQAVAAGRTVLLHLPLEPIGAVNPGPGTIGTEWSPEQVLAQLEADLSAVPGAIGVNNHMGSRGTSDENLMRVILSDLKQRGLFFVDSRTVKGSVVGQVARSLKGKYAVSNMFLDPEGASEETVQAKLRALIALARTNGIAIGICHANRPHTLAALRMMLPEFSKAGVEIVPVTELVRS